MACGNLGLLPSVAKCNYFICGSSFYRQSTLIPESNARYWYIVIPSVCASSVTR